MWYSKCHRGELGRARLRSAAQRRFSDELSGCPAAGLTLPGTPSLLVGVDVADGDGGEGQLLELDGDGHRGAVVVHEELRALPEDEPDSAECKQDPEEAAQAAAGHHDAAAAVRVGVEAVPPHQLAQRRRLRAPHRQRPLDPRRDLLPGGHGSCGTRRGPLSWSGATGPLHRQHRPRADSAPPR